MLFPTLHVVTSKRIAKIVVENDSVYLEFAVSVTVPAGLRLAPALRGIDCVTDGDVDGTLTCSRPPVITTSHCAVIRR